MNIPVRWAVVPPLVFGIVGGVVGAGFFSGCALALGYHNILTAAIFGYSIGLGFTFFFGFLIWLDWITPPEHRRVKQQTNDIPAEAYWPKSRNTEGVYRSKVITDSQLREIAYNAIHKQQSPNDRALSNIIGTNVPAWRDELMPRLADWNSYNSDGYPNRNQGWHYTKDGLDMLRSLVDDPPPLSYSEWLKHTPPAYAHTTEHTNYVS